jgi:Transglycosylase SLT domain
MTTAVGSVPGNLIDWAAGVIGIPSTVVAAQINDESGGQPDRTSPAGAQGVAQFEPSTWSALGCPGSPFDINAAMRCYAKYMYQLTRQFHGNVRDALAAYNAGPANLKAGYGYADQILTAAGQSSGLQAGQGSAASAGVSSAQQQQESAGAGCAWSIGGEHIGILFGHGPSLPSACILTKSEIRAVVGGLVLVAGVLIMLPGVILIAAYGLKASGVAQKATQAAGMIPGYGQAARAVAGGAAGGGRPRYRVTERTPLSGEMGGTRTVQYGSRRRPRPPGGAESA